MTKWLEWDVIEMREYDWLENMIEMSKYFWNSKIWLEWENITGTREYG